MKGVSSIKWAAVVGAMSLGCATSAPQKPLNANPQSPPPGQWSPAAASAPAATTPAPTWPFPFPLPNLFPLPSNQPTNQAAPPAPAGPPGQWNPSYGPQASATTPTVGLALTPHGLFGPDFRLPEGWANAQLPRLDEWLSPWLKVQLPSLPGWPAPGPAPNPAPNPAPAPGPNPGPPSDGWPAGWVAFESEVLFLTNQQRAMGAVCGGEPFAPTGPVDAHPTLRSAARGHSLDMGERGYFSHTSPEGASPSDRAFAAGWNGSGVGENIAAGQPTPAAVVDAWVKSPGHCANLMEPRYRFLGVGYAFVDSSSYGHFWTQNFGG